MESRGNVLSGSDAHDSCCSGSLWLWVERGWPRDKSRIGETRWEMMGCSRGRGVDGAGSVLKVGQAGLVDGLQARGEGRRIKDDS